MFQGKKLTGANFVCQPKTSLAQRNFRMAPFFICLCANGSKSEKFCVKDPFTENSRSENDGSDSDHIREHVR